MSEGQSLKALGVRPSNDITGSGGDDPESVKALAVLAFLHRGATVGELEIESPQGTPASASCRNRWRSDRIGNAATLPDIYVFRHMKPRRLISRLTGLLSLGAFVVVGNLFATGSIVEGTVRNGNGRPITNADVRIEARNGSNWSRHIKSDSNGFYIFDGLSPGVTYRVTLVVNGAVKASINNVLAKPGATQLNFDLKSGSVAGDRMVTKNGKHYVYVPAETGTHLGGRWVEVDENGNADSVGVNNVERVGSEALRRIQSNSGATGNMSGGGR